MTQTARTTAPATGTVPGQRTPAGPAAAESAVAAAGSAVPAVGDTGAVATLRRALAVARGLRGLRPVPAPAPRPYGEVDGH